MAKTQADFLGRGRPGAPGKGQQGQGPGAGPHKGPAAPGPAKQPLHPGLTEAKICHTRGLDDG